MGDVIEFNFPARRRVVMTGEDGTQDRAVMREITPPFNEASQGFFWSHKTKSPYAGISAIHVCEEPGIYRTDRLPGTIFQMQRGDAMIYRRDGSFESQRALYFAAAYPEFAIK